MVYYSHSKGNTANPSTRGEDSGCDGDGQEHTGWQTVLNARSVRGGQS